MGASHLLNLNSWSWSASEDALSCVKLGNIKWSGGRKSALGVSIFDSVSRAKSTARSFGWEGRVYIRHVLSRTWYIRKRLWRGQGLSRDFLPSYRCSTYRVYVWSWAENLWIIPALVKGQYWLGNGYREIRTASSSDIVLLNTASPSYPRFCVIALTLLLANKKLKSSPAGTTAIFFWNRDRNK